LAWLVAGAGKMFRPRDPTHGTNPIYWHDAAWIAAPYENAAWHAAPLDPTARQMRLSSRPTSVTQTASSLSFPLRYLPSVGQDRMKVAVTVELGPTSVIICVF
jgi:hypothetical protein